MDLRDVPTHLITGFLGSGKTSVILQLLQARPKNERWAVLVNEFGELGIDGTVLRSRHAESDGVFVAEVPGGCMGCAAALPMQVALNQLLARARPHRLLIEPSGLGHPEEVKRHLGSPFLAPVLALQKVVTVIDARKVSDPRYAEHPLFQQQCAIADVIVANKQDLYRPQDHAALQRYLAQQGRSDAPCYFTEQGQLALSSILGPCAAARSPHQPVEPDAHVPHTEHTHAPGMRSDSLQLGAEQVFAHAALRDFLQTLEVLRLKAVCITDEGIFAYNMSEGDLHEWPMDEAMENRIEIIGTVLPAHWKERLSALLC